MKWAEVALGDVTECLDRFRVPVKESERRSGDVPYFGANGQQGWIDRHIFNEPLVLVAEDGGHFSAPERGVAYRVDGPAWVNNHAHILRPGRCVDRDYLHWVLRNYDFTRFISGSTRSKLNQQQLMRATIPLPPLDEQRRIAAILDHAVDVSAKAREYLDLLDQLPPALLTSTFEDLDVARRPLSELAEIWDCAHSTPKWTESGKICLRTPNLSFGRWNWSDTRYVDDDQFKLRSKGSGAKTNDIILSREGTVGVAALVEPGMEIAMGQRLVQVRPDAKKIDAHVLLHYLLHALSPARIEHVMVGSTARHLNVKDLRELPVPVSPIQEQQKLNDILTRLADRRVAAEARIRSLDALFASLQARAFRGEL